MATQVKFKNNGGFRRKNTKSQSRSERKRTLFVSLLAGNTRLSHQSDWRKSDSHLSITVKLIGDDSQYGVSTSVIAVRH